MLDGALRGREYLLGGSFTIADLNVASVLSWAALAGLDLAPLAAARGWLASLPKPTASRGPLPLNFF